jgi:hypothetical protein
LHEKKLMQSLMQSEQDLAAKPDGAMPAEQPVDARLG